MLWTSQPILLWPSSLPSPLQLMYPLFLLRLTICMPHRLNSLTADFTNDIDEAAAPALDGLQLRIYLPDENPTTTIQELPTFASLVYDVRYLLSRSNHLKFQPDHSTLGHKHSPEYYLSRTRKIERPCSTIICITVLNQSFLPGEYYFGITDVKIILFKTRLYLLNVCWYQHSLSVPFFTDAA